MKYTLKPICIVDLNGCSIEIEDLDKAISIADDYKDYRHVNAGFEKFDKERNAYWTDIYEKLKSIKKLQSSKG